MKLSISKKITLLVTVSILLVVACSSVGSSILLGTDSTKEVDERAKALKEYVSVFKVQA